MKTFENLFFYCSRRVQVGHSNLSCGAYMSFNIGWQINLKLVLYLLISEKRYLPFFLFNRYISILNRLAKSIELTYLGVHHKISLNTLNT